MFNWATISANAQTMRGVIEQMQNARLHSIGVESVGASAALYRQICESRRNYNSVASSLTNRTVEPSPCRAGPGRVGQVRGPSTTDTGRAGRRRLVTLAARSAHHQAASSSSSSSQIQRDRRATAEMSTTSWRPVAYPEAGRAATLNPNP